MSTYPGGVWSGLITPQNGNSCYTDLVSFFFVVFKNNEGPSTTWLKKMSNLKEFKIHIWKRDNVKRFFIPDLFIKNLRNILQDVVPNKPGLALDQLQPCTTSSSSSTANTWSSTPPSPVPPFLLYYLLYNVHFYIGFAQKRLLMASRLTMCLSHFKCACVYQKIVVLQVKNKSHNGCKRLCVYYSSFHHGFK